MLTKTRPTSNPTHKKGSDGRRLDVHAARELAEAESLADELRQQYLAAKVLPDGSVAILIHLLFTVAIGLGCNSWGFSTRFCFEDVALAKRRWDALQSEDDEPQGFIASRGQRR